MIELLGTILKNENAIDGQTLEKALSMQQDTELSGGEHEALGTLLIRHFGVSEEVIYRALARQFSLEFVPNIIEKADNEIIHQLPVELLKEARLYPLNHDDAVARVIVIDPLDMEGFLSFKAMTGLVVEALLTTPTELKRAVDGLFEGDSMLKQSLGTISKEFEKQLELDETALIKVLAFVKEAAEPTAAE